MPELRVVIRELFYFFVVVFLAAAVLESIFPNIVLAYLNLNWLFLLVIIFGTIVLFDNN